MLLLRASPRWTPVICLDTVLSVLRATLQAICCQIMSIPGSLLQNTPGDESGNTWEYPRTAFTYMARDQRTARGVSEMAAALTQQV